MSVNTQRRARFFLLAIMALFLAPVILATLIYTFAPDWRPWGTTNNGALVSPPRPIGTQMLKPIDGSEMSDTFLRGRWTLLMLSPQLCDERCITEWQRIENVRLALGRDAIRVQRLMLAAMEQSPPPVLTLAERSPGLRIATAPGSSLTAFKVTETLPQNQGFLYVVDPKGLLMMYYQPETDGSLILKDLKRLLKASREG